MESTVAIRAKVWTVWTAPLVLLLNACDDPTEIVVNDDPTETIVDIGAPYSVDVLGTLGGSESLALDVNASGQVVGRAQRSDGTWAAFLWEEGVMRELESF